MPSINRLSGDLVTLQSGDKAPADLRLIRVKNLLVEEAALTGESLPTAKGTGSVPPNAPLGDRSCVAYSGTMVVQGTATGVVVATGNSTELGRINALLNQTSQLETPLTRQLAKVSNGITVAVVIVVAVLIAFGIWVKDAPVGKALMVAVSLAVAAIPEGLPAVITICLAVGVRRMAERHAVVRHLPAVETLGSTSVICSDKTGTLTRNEAMDAIRICHGAGIMVKMITGDHPVTAEAIGRQLGLLQHGQTAMQGKDLDGLSEAQLRDAVMSTNVFARVAPEHKIALVQALQAQRHVVAMTGDGVNDVPALKRADIGVAMGITGTAVSKEAAKVVLMDDNFASIAAAVEEGRRVYDHLVRSLAFEVLEPQAMKRAPRPPGEPVFSGFIVARLIVVALLMSAGACGLFLWEYFRIAGTEPVSAARHAFALTEAQSICVTSITFTQIFYLLNCRSLRNSLRSQGVFSNLKITKQR